MSAQDAAAVTVRTARHPQTGQRYVHRQVVARGRPGPKSGLLPGQWVEIGTVRDPVTGWEHQYEATDQGVSWNWASGVRPSSELDQAMHEMHYGAAGAEMLQQARA